MPFSKMYIFGPQLSRRAWYGIILIREKPALRAGLIIKSRVKEQRKRNFLKIKLYIIQIVSPPYCRLTEYGVIGTCKHEPSQSSAHLPSLVTLGGPTLAANHHD